MARARSPIRIARLRRDDVINVEEQEEWDFQFGVTQGIALYAARLTFVDITPTASSAMTLYEAFMSLHLETGTLEGASDEAPAEGQPILNSEIVAEAVLNCIIQDEAAVRGGSAVSVFYPKDGVYDYVQMLGSPLIIAQNPTVRAVTNSANFSVDPIWELWYKYIELTEAELVEQFVLRR